MNWADEKYVRLYTRNTGDWMCWPWQSRALLPLLMRTVDRAGVLDVGRYGAKAVAVLVGLPEEVVSVGLDGLVHDGCVELRGEQIVIRNFMEAQECGHSDRVRQAESRRRRRDGAPVTPVTQTPEITAPVTVGHSLSQPVTDRHPVLSLAVPSRTEEHPASAGVGEQDEPSRPRDESPPVSPDPPKARKPRAPPDPEKHPDEAALHADGERWRVRYCERSGTKPADFKWGPAWHRFRDERKSRGIEALITSLDGLGKLPGYRGKGPGFWLRVDGVIEGLTAVRSGQIDLSAMRHDGPVGKVTI